MGGSGTSTADGEAAFLNAEDGVVTPTDPGWLQMEFYFLAGLFNRVGMKTNLRNNMGVVCRHFWADGVRVDESYT